MFWVKLASHSELHFQDVPQLQWNMTSRKCNELDMVEYKILSKNKERKEW